MCTLRVLLEFRVASGGGLHSFNCATVVAVDQAGETTTAAREHSKLSEQDKVQWLTERLAHSVTDLSRTRPDQNSPNSDKGR